MNFKTNRSLNLGLSGLTLLLGACAQERASGDVPTSLIMTGSSATSVASLSEPWIFRQLLPTAVALPAPTMQDSNGATVLLSEAWISIKEIELEQYETDAEEVEAEGESDDAGEYDFDGPYVIDLLADNPEAIGDVTVPASGLKRFKMKLHPLEENLPAGSPAEIERASMLLIGTANGNTFTYKPHDETEFEIRGSNAVIPQVGNDLVVNFRFAQMFSKIDMSAVTNGVTISDDNRVSSPNACPLIDSSADDLFTCFRKAIEASAKFGKDNDGDGELEDDEDSVDNED